VAHCDQKGVDESFETVEVAEGRTEAAGILHVVRNWDGSSVLKEEPALECVALVAADDVAEEGLDVVGRDAGGLATVAQNSPLHLDQSSAAGRVLAGQVLD